MRVSSKLNFVEVKVKKKFDGTGVYPVAVFYDSSSESLVKPFLEDGQMDSLKMLKPMQVVVVDMDVYQGKNGMTCRLNRVMTETKAEAK